MINMYGIQEFELKLWNFSRKLLTRLLSDNFSDFEVQSEPSRRNLSSFSLL